MQECHRFEAASGPPSPPEATDPRGTVSVNRGGGVAWSVAQHRPFPPALVGDSTGFILQLIEVLQCLQWRGLINSDFQQRLA